MRSALAERAPKDYSIEDLKKRYNSIDESTNLPKDKLQSIVKSVNAVSKQLLSDLEVPKEFTSTPMGQYYHAICATSDPHINETEREQSPRVKLEYKNFTKAATTAL